MLYQKGRSDPPLQIHLPIGFIHHHQLRFQTFDPWNRNTHWVKAFVRDLYVYEAGITPFIIYVMYSLLHAPPHQSQSGQTACEEYRAWAQRGCWGPLPRLLHQRTHQLPQEELCLSWATSVSSTMQHDQLTSCMDRDSQKQLVSPTQSSWSTFYVCSLLMNIVTVYSALISMSVTSAPWKGKLVY